MKFVDYMLALRRSWLLIVLLTVVGAIALALPNSTKTQSYRVTTRVIVGPSESVQGTAIDDAVRNLTTNGAVLKTFALMLKSDAVVDKAAATAGIDRGALGGYTIDAFSLNETAAVELDVTGPDPAAAGRLADGIGKGGVEQFEGLYRSFRAEPLDAAVPTQQKPQTLLYGFVGAVAGFLLGFLIAVARFAIADAGGLKRAEAARRTNSGGGRGSATGASAAEPARTPAPFTRAWEIATVRPGSAVTRPSDEDEWSSEDPDVRARLSS